MASPSGGNSVFLWLASLAIVAWIAGESPTAAQTLQPGAPVESSTLAPPDAVQSGELTPLTPTDASPVPAAGGAPVAAPASPSASPAPSFASGFWRGVPANDVAALLAKTELPLRSPTMAGLWRRAMTSDEAPDGVEPGQFLAERLDGLYRAGLLKDAAALIARSPKSADAQQLAAGARVLLGLGDDAKACAAVKTIPLSGGPLKGRIRNDALLMVAYCAARDKQPNHAELAATVLRDQSFAEPLALAVLDSIAENKTPKLPRTDNITLIDYKFLSLLGNVPAERFLARAAPDLIVAIANDPAAEPGARLAAAEAADRINAIEDADLAALYRVASFQPQQLSDPGAALAAFPPAMQRALLFQAAEHETAPVRKADYVRQMLDSARHDDMFTPVARLCAYILDAVRPTPDLAGVSETAIETLLAAGRFDHAVGWTLLAGTTAGPGGNALLHWLTLVDIGDAGEHVPHGSSMNYADQLAAGGSLSPLMLQRLAVVLDALRYDMPASVLQGAQAAKASISKADQGHPPDAGLVHRLQEAAQQKITGMTVLLAVNTVGTGQATSLHPQALSEVIKALMAAGLEGDARRLALEALFEAWPPRITGLGNVQ